MEMDVNLGEARMDISREVIGTEGEEEPMGPERAAKCLQEWAKRHRKALIGINAVETIREARESR
jgi:hypothetical protein